MKVRGLLERLTQEFVRVACDGWGIISEEATGEAAVKARRELDYALQAQKKAQLDQRELFERNARLGTIPRDFLALA